MRPNAQEGMVNHRYTSPDASKDFDIALRTVWIDKLDPDYMISSGNRKQKKSCIAKRMLQRVNNHKRCCLMYVPIQPCRFQGGLS